MPDIQINSKEESVNSLYPMVMTQPFTAKGLGSVPNQETKILQAIWYNQKNINKVNKIGRDIPSLLETTEDTT